MWPFHRFQETGENRCDVLAVNFADVHPSISKGNGGQTILQKIPLFHGARKKILFKFGLVPPKMSLFIRFWDCPNCSEISNWSLSLAVSFSRPTNDPQGNSRQGPQNSQELSRERETRQFQGGHGSVRLRFGGGTVRAVQVFGSGGFQRKRTEYGFGEHGFKHRAQ